MAVKRHAVELRQDINRSGTGIEAVADRDVDQPIFAAKRDGRFGTIFGERKQTCAGATTHHNRQGPLRCSRRKRGQRWYGETLAGGGFGLLRIELRMHPSY